MTMGDRFQDYLSAKVLKILKQWLFYRATSKGSVRGAIWKRESGFPTELEEPFSKKSFALGTRCH
jgi:hypothetical protein